MKKSIDKMKDNNINILRGSSGSPPDKKQSPRPHMQSQVPEFNAFDPSNQGRFGQIQNQLGYSGTNEFMPPPNNFGGFNPKQIDSIEFDNELGFDLNNLDRGNSLQRIEEENRNLRCNYFLDCSST